MAKTTERKPRILQPPKTAVVVVTVSPQATSGGLFYASVFKTAWDSLSRDFGTAGIRLRLAQTGVEFFSGDDGAKMAVTFAEKLRKVFAAQDGLKISRPTNCGELRISGLDDTITAEGACVAVQGKTTYNADSIRVGAIRTCPGGFGFLADVGS